jgi:hypothetical protein
MPKCLGHKLFINEEKKKPSSMWETCLWARDVDFLKGNRKKKINCLSIQNQLIMLFGQLSDCPNALA